METTENKDESVRRQLLALAGMTRPQLCDKWRDLYGSEPPNSSREFLRRRLAYRIQEIMYGGLDAALKAALTVEPAPGKAVTTLRDGTKIVREWHGREYEVVVRGEKYEYAGKLYRSLSGVAKAITNTNWNGNEFFGIRKR
jgi:hypothetical protein